MSESKDFMFLRLEKAIEEAALEESEKLIKQARIDFESKMRERIGKIIFRMYDMYSIEKNSQELLIRVKIGL